MPEFIKTVRAEEIPRNGMKALDIEGLKILLINADGKYYAIENRCPHMGYPLYYGSLEGTTLTCGFHYAKFDIAAGKVMNEVTDRPLRTFKLVVKDSQIFVEL